MGNGQDRADETSNIPPRYEQLVRLGSGAMGNVYLAHDSYMDRDVAIKLLSGSYSRESQIRFQREAKAASKLKHPNLITILDFGFGQSSQPFLVMQYVGGSTLKELLARGPLPAAEACKYAVEVLLGLEHAHSAGVLHRDIKPANVVIDETGEARVLDFGLAKLMGDEQELTASGAALGTPYYMSPEQANAGPVDQRSDVYSLGCMLFECLTGRKPYAGATAQETLMMHLAAPIPNAADFASGLPEGLDAIVRRAMSKLPEERYQSAMAMAGELYPFVEGRLSDDSVTLLARRPLAEVSVRSVRDSGRLMALAATAVLIVIAFSTAGWYVFSTGRAFLPGPSAGVTSAPQVRIERSGERAVITVESSATTSEAVLERSLNDIDDVKEVVVKLPEGAGPGRDLDVSRVDNLIRAIARAHPGLSTLRLIDVPLDRSSISLLSGFDGLSSVVLTSNGLSDGALEPLTGLGRLRVLAVNGQRISDAALQSISKLKDLEAVYLGRNSKISGKGLASLHGLNLRAIGLSNTRCTAESIKRLLGAQKRVETLLIAGLDVADDDMQDILSACPGLISLSAAGNPITDRTIDYLISHCKKLRDVDLRKCEEISTAARSRLEGLPNLKVGVLKKVREP